jgi:hypothetical protein
MLGCGHLGAGRDLAEAVRVRCPIARIIEGQLVEIDWTKFKQGKISDEMWSRFKYLVELCSEYRHLHDVKRQIKRDGTQMYRAAFLASELMMGPMPALAQKAGEGSADWKLCTSLILALNPSPHERGRYKAAAFSAFDAEQELQAEEDEIARRWMKRAGYEHEAEKIAKRNGT